MFGLSRVLFHLLIYHLEQPFNISPFLVRFENLLNKLAKEPFLQLINNVNVGKFALKGILAINDLVQDTSKGEDVRFRVNVEVSVII